MGYLSPLYLGEVCEDEEGFEGLGGTCLGSLSLVMAWERGGGKSQYSWQEV